MSTNTRLLTPTTSIRYHGFTTNTPGSDQTRAACLAGGGAGPAGHGCILHVDRLLSGLSRKTPYRQLPDGKRPVHCCRCHRWRCWFC